MALTDATSSEHYQWFKIDRHDDATSQDATESGTDTTETDDDEEAARLLADATADGEDDEAGDDDPEGAEQLGDKGKKALDAMKARLKAEREKAKRDLAALRKQASDQAAKLAEFEEADKSEKEKLALRAERSEKLAAEATARAVKAEVRALSVDQFADPSDAADVLMRDPSKYVDASGEIDEDAIRADLDDLLERKPHWRKPEPGTNEPKKTPAKPKPKPDPGQGGRGDKPIDFRTADQATVEAEYAKYGLRPRR